MSERNEIPADVRATIEQRLDTVEAANGVRILFAIESGSRAWGFPSPDSDYDVRFVYAHAPDWYLAIDPRRDVIELPIEGDLDINGWDLKKALQLLIKPNPVLLEWLRSPILYRADRPAMDRLAALGERTAHLRPSTHHYLHLCRSQYRRFIDGKTEVALKKYFYALRPALALMWLSAHPDRPVPMAMPRLRDGLDLPDGVSDFLDDLLRRKAVSRELGSGPRIAALDGLIERAMADAPDAPDADRAPAPGLLNEANALFRDLVREAA